MANDDKRSQDNLDPQQRSEIGQKGGQAAQDSGNAHELNDKDRSKGGAMSGGNFKNDPGRASEVASQRNQS